MSAPITDADRAAAEKVLRDIWFENGKKPRDPSGGVEVVAQAIADARMHENKICLAVIHSSPDLGEAVNRILARRLS